MGCGITMWKVFGYREVFVEGQRLIRNIRIILLREQHKLLLRAQKCVCIILASITLANTAAFTHNKHLLDYGLTMC